MWRMQSGNRVFTASEWEIFASGLGAVREAVEDDLRYDTADAETGVAIFDRCSSEQMLALLADVATALHDPDVPCPKHTATNEAAVAAVLRAFWYDLVTEVDEDSAENIHSDFRYANRRMLLAAFQDEDNQDLPDVADTDISEWSFLYESFEERIFWDEDFAMADDLLDLSPEVMQAMLRQLTIDRDYFVAVPREPNEAELISARQMLAKILGLPMTDDEGFYRFLGDEYHDLLVGPCSEQEAAVWEIHPWVRSVGCAELRSDCSYDRWTELFTDDLPDHPYQICLDPVADNADLPNGISIERFGSNWVIREKGIGIWCGLIENGWTDAPDQDDPPLTFPTEQQAKSAYLHAEQMYTQRAGRRKVAFEKLGIPEFD